MEKQVLHIATASTDITDVGITIDNDCLDSGNCGWNIYKTLQIREDLQQGLETGESGFQVFTQDIFLSATFFIGTVITFALVYSGLLIVLGGANENTVQKGKDGVKRSLIGLILVIFSFTIIRGVQFIAQGQS